MAAHTHYMPEHWVGKAHTLEVRRELLSLFSYKAQLFLEVWRIIVCFFLIFRITSAGTDVVTSSKVQEFFWRGSRLP